MPLDVGRLLKDHRIDYDTSQNKGWYNVKCPWCDDRGLHCGFRDGAEYANCWRCGWRPLEATLAKILRLPERSVWDVLAPYQTGRVVFQKLNKKVPTAKQLTLPTNGFTPGERQYLRRRGFDPVRLLLDYSVVGGGIVGRWAYRIVIPLLVGGRIVSWTARDITGDREPRYYTLSVEESVLDPKTLLFNEDHAGESGVVVLEGPFDVLRFGPGGVGSFGTTMTPAQIRRLLRFRRVTFLFDPEPEAQARATKYAKELALIAGGKCRVEVVDTEMAGDPASMTQGEIDGLKRELGV